MVAPIEYPVELVTAVPSICALADIVVAPSDDILIGATWIVATPVASVRAVPLEGYMATSVSSVVKETTVFGTAAPLVSLRVAFALAGEPLDIEVTAIPVVASTRESVSVGAGVVEGVVEGGGVVGSPPQPAREAAITAIKVNDPARSRNLSLKATPSSN